MKLTQDQIQELFKFTRKHYVEYYDVQLELVDHLANGIEEVMVQRPQLTFKEALDLEFKKFGVFGFYDVIKKKSDAMHKRYWKIFFRFYKEYFKLPKVLMLFAASTLLFLVLRALPVETSKYIPGLAILIVLVLFLINVFRNRRKQRSKTRKWLLEDMIAANGNIFIYLNFALQILLFPNLIKWPLGSPLGMFMVSFVVVLIGILFHVMVNIIPHKTEELLAETYPEYKMT
ncbi:hypothetical protein HZY62_05290 [Maribacter polysiphoniae]|uniref:Uncharacterized protein n=1 Tax=Maribacter polysiphoniae TaxID=429344 RepID=A0A316EQW1_9FLAO|nr:hypothetical protein [Maribacter polysiphoniae]MBD1259993.1 hypothetical protein [Maribacter polysiphoniae]PWK25450.1 hypothetical protein LX92_00189 [Maribacter polysiphoniae]